MDEAVQGPVLVLGATGLQGGCAARALLARGRAVRALVRNAEVPAALALRQAGAELVVGTFNEPPSLLDACQGAQGLFSMQNAPFTDPNSERREASNVVAAARAAGVRHVVHTSVSGAGAFHRGMRGFEEGRWSRNYWDSKAFAEDAVRQAGFQHVTILRPAFMMENFLRPKSDFMFPDLANHQIVTAIWPQTRLVLVSGGDVGLAAAAAFSDPARFDGATIELAGDDCTMDEMARTLSAVSGQTIIAQSLPADQVIARGQFPGWVNTQEWFNEVGYPAKREDTSRFGLHTVDFATWSRDNAATL